MKELAPDIAWKQLETKALLWLTVSLLHSCPPFWKEKWHSKMSVCIHIY